MRKLLNTLYVTLSDTYLALDGENVIVRKEEEIKLRMPLHNLEGIVAFGYTGASPALMGKCAEKNIALTFLTANGKFLARVSGKSRGNVILRREQYRIADTSEQGLSIAKNCIVGKVYNSRHVLARAARDYPQRIDVEGITRIVNQLADSIVRIRNAESMEQLRGFEGEAASSYFSVFNDLILQQKEDFVFETRNRRPPTDFVNAMLSFAYTLLMHDVEAALETVGLDSYVGFLHTDRPGRASLALDMMEELRPVLADRFVISLINKKIINAKGFEYRENGAVLMDNDTRRSFLKQWQERKQEKIKHPFLEESIEWGLIPYVQAMLLARYIRGDVDEYPPFMWR